MLHARKFSMMWTLSMYFMTRWALYPPGKVPLGVTVHVNEDDGDVNIDTPASLQWWLDFYPLLSDEDKPIDCTQLPVICLDMASGYRHKGICRAGILALDEGSFEDVKNDSSCRENSMNCSDLMRKEKRMKMHEPTESNNLENVEFAYDIKFLLRFLDGERDHYNSEWTSSNVIGQRNMREWLHKLWVDRPDLRGLIWKGACLALNAGRWYECSREICAFHSFPLPTDEEKLPIGTGSNPVYPVAENVIKIFVEGGPEVSLYALGTELQFYNLLPQVNSPLKDHIPGVLAFSKMDLIKLSLGMAKGSLS
ncbi:hypothetical protein ACH5RR_026914 [Cinchona calisaya]|uniref:Uncharacterized protein n=1 Tax=Cinchona calisaya TaxID=153742 RepID=A0ABD2Z3Y9_9GENT